MSMVSVTWDVGRVEIERVIQAGLFVLWLVLIRPLVVKRIEAVAGHRVLMVVLWDRWKTWQRHTRPRAIRGRSLIGN